MTKQTKTLEWQVVSKKGVNFENFLMSLFAHGYIDLNNQKIKKFGPMYATGYCQIDTHRNFLEKDCEAFVKRAKALEAKKPGSILKSYYDYDKLIKQIEKFADSFFKKDFPKQSTAKLVTSFEQFAKIAGKTIWYAYNYYFYQYLGDELYSILNQKEKDINKQAQIFEVLTQGTEFSVTQKEQKGLLLLVKKIKKENLSLNSNKVKKLINNHSSTYSYMGFHYFRGQAYDQDYFLKRIKQRLKTNFETELEKIKRLEKDNKNWLVLAKKLDLNKSEIIMVKTLKQMAYCTNRFDEVSNFLYAKAQSLLKEIAQRLNISYKELIEMDKLEIIDYLKKEKSIDQKFKKILSQRLKGSAFLMLKGKVKIMAGQDLFDYRQQEVKQEALDKNLKLLKGQPASAGKVSGKAVLVFSISDLDKVKKGDIMIAKSTVPSFVPAMEKAGGIVTEMSGLLSHAAIVARELKTPCVVGVNEAMRIIKNGQRVEVNATKGVIKKL